ncbi:MAG: hypothetical protein NTX52_05040 [Planctomycetota bacterium]|nr:hypothetical protein [Planctomycetota bacterium]
MTRRKFIRVLAKAGAGIVVGILWLARQTFGGLARAPRKFMRALPVKRYPGSLKSMGDVSRGGKWSG